MDFNLTEEQQMIRDAAREFAQGVIVPVAAEFDESGTFPVETIRQAGELGFMGIEIPEEYGGSGMDSISYMLVMIEFSAADAAHGTIISVNNSLFRGTEADVPAPCCIRRSQRCLRTDGTSIRFGRPCHAHESGAFGGWQ